MNINNLLFLVLTLQLISCQKEQKKPSWSENGNFNADMVSTTNPVKKIKGQTLYLPVYSNIPYHDELSGYNLSAFVAVHNTDFKYNIRITRVFYLNNDGILVKNFLPAAIIVLKPMGATNFFIPEQDTSGVGANFILEWESDSLVNEPLVESIMVSLTSGQGVTFTSTGKILNEVK